MSDSERCLALSGLTVKHAPFRLRELMLGFVVLSIVFALSRAALVIQVQEREPTVVSVVIEIAAGGLLGLALGVLLVRLCHASRAFRP